MNPYAALGRAAFDAAAEAFDIGSVGAGTGALTGTVKGGLGSASCILENGFVVGALVAVNPVGTVTLPDQPQFWAWAEEIGEEYGGLEPPAARPIPVTLARTKLAETANPRESTTIAVVATDAALDKAQVTRLAVAAQDGLARAIQPSHTPLDGDLVFAVDGLSIWTCRILDLSFMTRGSTG